MDRVKIQIKTFTGKTLETWNYSCVTIKCKIILQYNRQDESVSENKNNINWPTLGVSKLTTYEKLMNVVCCAKQKPHQPLRMASSCTAQSAASSIFVYTSTITCKSGNRVVAIDFYEDQQRTSFSRLIGC